MVDILHRIAAKGVALDDAAAALATTEGIRSWWIGTTDGEASEGGHLSFGDVIEADVVQADPKRVDWQITAGPEEWIGTHVTFDLSSTDGYTVVLFKHAGWAEPVEFMHHCSTKWGTFMVSLKQLLETGTGAPTPHDVHIDNWG